MSRAYQPPLPRSHSAQAERRRPRRRSHRSAVSGWPAAVVVLALILGSVALAGLLGGGEDGQVASVPQTPPSGIATRVGQTTTPTGIGQPGTEVTPGGSGASGTPTTGLGEGEGGPTATAGTSSIAGIGAGTATPASLAPPPRQEASRTPVSSDSPGSEAVAAAPSATAPTRAGAGTPPGAVPSAPGNLPGIRPPETANGVDQPGGSATAAGLSGGDPPSPGGAAEGTASVGVSAPVADGASRPPGSVDPVVAGVNATGSVVQRPGTEQPAEVAPFYAHRVQAGDTIRSIAERYGVPTEDIVRESALENADLLEVGRLLTVPRAPGALHRVQAGESLTQVAAAWGVRLDVLRVANPHLPPNGSVPAGAVILIPTGYVAQVGK